MIAKLQMKFIGKKLLSSKYWLFEFVVPENFNFDAGQYLSFKVDERGLRRSYSIASEPGKKRIEILLDVSPMGAGCKFLLGLKDGQKIEALGAMGGFVIIDSGELTVDKDSSLVFVGTGSGVAPLRSMIRDLLINKNNKSKIRLYWGLRFEKDVFWTDELNKLKNEYSNFDYDLVLSKPSEKWSHCSGHVTDCLLKHSLSFVDTDFYLCGSKAMVEEIREFLLDKGVEKKRIFFEKFW